MCANGKRIGSSVTTIQKRKSKRKCQLVKTTQNKGEMSLVSKSYCLYPGYYPLCYKQWLEVPSV